VDNQQIPRIIHESWHQYLQPLFNDRKMLGIKDKLLPNCKSYPARGDIFRVFAMPLNEIKVVILGQDPYPNGEAIGLSFAVNRENPKPKSLQIIEKEIASEYPKSGWALDRTLSHWVNQGIFLLNSALTVQAKESDSHTLYWEWFTRAVIAIIAKSANPIWLLWGSKAKAFESVVLANTLPELKPAILKASHPMAEGYNKEIKEKFSGCNHFFLVNKELDARGLNRINW